MGSDLQPGARFELLAGAVAGFTVPVVLGEHDRAWSDGETIHLPAGDARARDTVVVQAALLAAGSLEPRVVTRTTGRRVLRHRYLTLEALRAVHALGPRAPAAVTRRLAADAPVAVPASAEESLRRASGREDVPEAPAWLGTIKPGRVVLHAPMAGGGRPTDAEAEGRFKPSALDELDDEEESERSRIMELFSAPVLRNPAAELLQKLLGAGRSPSAGGGGGEEAPVGSQQVGRVGADARIAAAPAGLELHLDGPPRGVRYPEWHWARGVYRRDWCSVAEFDPREPPEPGEPDPGHDRLVHRELARLGLAVERHRRLADGDALDLSALVDDVVERAAGGTGDGRVYERRLRTAHDLGVLVLLDATGSTDTSEEGRKVFDEQRRVAARLIANLEALDDRVAGYGFQSYGRSGVRYLRVKGFDDRFDHRAQARLAALQPGGFTRLGAAVRHGTRLLVDRSGATHRLLVVVGDGLPYDDGYEHRYAQEDTRRALQEAVDAGVGCACVGVRTSTEPEILERVWGHVPHLRLEEAEDLHREVQALFRRGLREAEARSRVSVAPA